MDTSYALKLAELKYNLLNAISNERNFFPRGTVIGNVKYVQAEVSYDFLAGYLGRSYKQDRYIEAELYVDDSSEMYPYIRFGIPKALDDTVVISLSNFFFRIGRIYDSNIARNMVLVVDFSACDFRFISVADRLFASLAIFKGVKVLLPSGDKALSPVNVYHIFGSTNIINADEVMEKMSFDALINRDGMLSGREFKTFNFDYKGANINNKNCVIYNHVYDRMKSMRFFNFSNMLSNCKKLEYVTGHMNTTEQIYPVLTNSLFSECVKLKAIGDSVFKGVRIVDCSGMFQGCTNLVKCGLTVDNFEGIENPVDSLFAGCDSIKIEDVKDIISCISERVGIKRVFEGCKTDKIHGERIKIYNGMGIFAGIESRTLDLSGVECVLDGVSIGILDYIYDLRIDVGVMNASVYTMIGTHHLIEYIQDRSPSVIIVNESMPICDFDRENYDIIDIDRQDLDTIDTKSKIAAMFGMGKTIYIVHD